MVTLLPSSNQPRPSPTRRRPHRSKSLKKILFVVVVMMLAGVPLLVSLQLSHRVSVEMTQLQETDRSQSVGAFEENTDSVSTNGRLLLDSVVPDSTTQRLVAATTPNTPSTTAKAALTPTVPMSVPSTGVNFIQPPQELCGTSFTSFSKEWLSKRTESTKDQDNDPTTTFLWTVSGGKSYLQRLPMLLQHWTRLGLTPLTVVSLDADTANTACRLGHFALLWDPPQRTYSRVADAKFGVTAALAKHHTRQWFMELDIFCRASPIPLMRQEMIAPKPMDIVHLGHGDMNFYPNIGMYCVQPKERTAQHFARLLDVLEYSKDHPQYIGSGGNLKPFFDQDTYYHCLPPYEPYGFDFGARLQRKYYTIESNMTLDLLDKCRLNQMPISYKALSHTDIISHHPPVVLDHTICVHPLSDAAFSSLDIKIATSKFMGFDPEFDVPHARTENKRYLKEYAGDLVNNECWNTVFLTTHVHSGNNGEREMFQYQVASLILLAMKSKRILVLPRHFRDKNAWAASFPAVVDVRTIGKLVNYTFATGEQARQIPVDDRESVWIPDTFAPENLNQTLRTVKSFSSTPVVELRRSCGLTTHKPGLRNDPAVLRIVQKLYWCLDEPDFDPVFQRAIGSFQRFCTKPEPPPKQ